jgi:hypothetical protein
MEINKRKHNIVLKETRRINGLKVHSIIAWQEESHGFEFKMSEIHKM